MMGGAGIAYADENSSSASNSSASPSGDTEGGTPGPSTAGTSAAGDSPAESSVAAAAKPRRLPKARVASSSVLSTGTKHSDAIDSSSVDLQGGSTADPAWHKKREAKLVANTATVGAKPDSEMPTSDPRSVEVRADSTSADSANNSMLGTSPTTPAALDSAPVSSLAPVSTATTSMKTPVAVGFSARTSPSGVAVEALALAATAAAVVPSETYLQQFRDADPTGQYFTPASSDWNFTPQTYTPEEYRAFIADQVARSGTSGFSQKSTGELQYTNRLDQNVAVLFAPVAGGITVPSGIRIVRPGATVVLPYPDGAVAMAELPRSYPNDGQIAVAAVGYTPFTKPVSSGGRSSSLNGLFDAFLNPKTGVFSQIAGLAQTILSVIGDVGPVAALGKIASGALGAFSLVTSAIDYHEGVTDQGRGRVLSGGLRTAAGVLGIAGFGGAVVGGAVGLATGVGIAAGVAAAAPVLVPVAIGAAAIGGAAWLVHTFTPW